MRCCNSPFGPVRNIRVNFLEPLSSLTSVVSAVRAWEFPAGCGWGPLREKGGVGGSGPGPRCPGRGRFSLGWLAGAGLVLGAFPGCLSSRPCALSLPERKRGEGERDRGTWLLKQHCQRERERETESALTEGSTARTRPLRALTGPGAGSYRTGLSQEKNSGELFSNGGSTGKSCNSPGAITKKSFLNDVGNHVAAEGRLEACGLTLESGSRVLP